MSQIRYRTDAEYEEHFRTVFATAVQRNLRSDKPVAELSGGRDSSSIVCMADDIIARGNGDTPRLDTISYYDDSEPNWNERPYFTKVEERGLAPAGTSTSARRIPDKIPAPEPQPESVHNRFVSTPGYDGRTSPQIRMCMASQGNRVVLSGIGGDEVMGGVPTPVPELENLLARAQFGVLAHQLKIWALEEKALVPSVWEAARDFLSRTRGCPETHATGPMAPSQLCAALLDSTDRLPLQNEAIRSLAKLPGQREHTG